MSHSISDYVIDMTLGKRNNGSQQVLNQTAYRQYLCIAIHIMIKDGDLSVMIATAMLHSGIFS
jgi:hypothetical protein